MSKETRRWYAEPLVWLLLSPVIVTVALGTATIILSTRIGGWNALPGEYTPTGKLLALDAAAQHRSETLAAASEGWFEGDAAELVVRLRGTSPLPERLSAQFIHATLPERDVTVTLERRAGAYRGALPARLPDRGQLHLLPGDGSWRLVAPIATDRPLRFSPIQL